MNSRENFLPSLNNKNKSRTSSFLKKVAFAVSLTLLSSCLDGSSPENVQNEETVKKNLNYKALAAGIDSTVPQKYAVLLNGDVGWSNLHT